MIQLFNGDCLEVMNELPDNSIDFILTDLPYGTSKHSWDSVIDYKNMWEQIKRIRKDNTAIALFGIEPFSSHLRLSNLDEYKYDWTWIKSRNSNPFTAYKQPLKHIENIVIFYKKNKYYPIIETNTKEYVTRYNAGGNIAGSKTANNHTKKLKKEKRTTRLPKNYLIFSSIYPQNLKHPTQKPTALLEYLIKTYTLENEIVLDFTMGSGSTGVACVNTNRDFIGIELDREYYETATTRIEEASGS